MAGRVEKHEIEQSQSAMTNEAILHTTAYDHQTFGFHTNMKRPVTIRCSPSNTCGKTTELWAKGAPFQILMREPSFSGGGVS